MPLRSGYRLTIGLITRVKISQHLQHHNLASDSVYTKYLEDPNRNKKDSGCCILKEEVRVWCLMNINFQISKTKKKFYRFITENSCATIELTNGSEHFKMVNYVCINMLIKRFTYSKTLSKITPAVTFLFTHNIITHIMVYFLHNTYHYMKCSC